MISIKVGSFFPWMWILVIATALAMGQSAEAGLTIVLDPGHGGTEAGAQRDGVREADLVLDIAKRCERVLINKGHTVYLTRESNQTLGLKERPEIANNFDADVFISIHANSAVSSDLYGIETYSVDIASDGYSAMVALKENAGQKLSQDDIPSVNTSTMLLSMELADLVQRTFVEDIGLHYHPEAARDLGHKTALFSVLVKAHMPAILLEVGFMSNENEFKQLQSAHYRETIATSLVRALNEWEERNK